jgi:hypothetical protein
MTPIRALFQNYFHPQTSHHACFSGLRQFSTHLALTITITIIVTIIR